MTLERQDHRIEHEAAPVAATAYPFPFGAMRKEDIRVYIVNPDTGRRLPAADAVVTPAPRGIRYGGEATLSATPAAGSRVEIARETPMRQENVYDSQSRIRPESIEAALDKAMMIDQELRDAAALDFAALTSDLAAETQARTDADAALGQRVDSEAATRAAADAALAEAKADADDPRLSDARTPLPHADSHAEGGSDPVAPADIGALGREHVAPALVPDPHPQYATHGYVDLATGGKSFFIFGNGGVRVRGDIGDDALNGMFELAAGGVRLKGSV